MPMGSDQPFTIEACVRARRISVLADYDYYYAVRRLSADNITYSSRKLRRLHAVQSIMTVVAKLLEPGPRRDAVLVRHFTWEAAKLLADDLLADPRDVQERVRDGVAELVELYLTDRIADQLEAETRLRLRLARDATVDTLLAAIEQDARHGGPPTLIERGRWYGRYRGFRDPLQPAPDAWFDVTDFAAGWSARLNATAVGWVADAAGDRALEIVARSPLPDLPALGGEEIGVRAEGLTADTTVTPDGEGTVVRARFRVDEIVADTGPRGGRRPVRTELTMGGAAASAALRAAGLRLPKPAVRRHRGRLFAVGARRDYTGQLVIAVVPLTAPRVLAALRKRWSRGRR
jgi:hypothetical protein